MKTRQSKIVKEVIQDTIRKNAWHQIQGSDQSYGNDVFANEECCWR